MEIKSKNPFRVSFLSVAVICCVVLSSVFLVISYRNEMNTKKGYVKEKAEQVMTEWETQLFMMKEVALRIVSDYEFQPYYFKKDIAKELSMLETFKQYKYYLALTEEYFIDYGEKWIYCSSGTTSDRNVYIRKKANCEEELERFCNELEEMKKELSKICGEPELLAIFDELYVLIPLKVNTGNDWEIAVLGFVVQKSSLEQRFQMAGVGMKGGMTLYGEEGILYTNQKQPSIKGQNNVITVTSADERYILCYLPENNYNIQSGLLIMIVLLGLTDILLIFVVGNFYAKRAYRPIKDILEKYRRKKPEGKKYISELEELDYILDDMYLDNIEAKEQIQKKQKIIRDQILCMLLDNNAFGKIQSYLHDAGICLDGPFFCVVSISFEEESEVSTEFLVCLQKELELIPDKREKEHVYSVCNFEKKILNLICSADTEISIEYLIEMVCDVTESFSYPPIIGVGNTYQSLHNVSVSWMESMNSIQCSKKQIHEAQDYRGLIYGKDGLQRITLAMDSGYEEVAIERLERFVKELEDNSISMLMLQYIWAEFLGEFHKLEDKYQLEIFVKNIDHFFAVKGVESFEKNTQKLIHEFCESYKELKNRKEDKIINEVYEYINEHFSEYDISIEKVASDLHTSTDTVREAILSRTGKLYRDYLIHLRIEYAKVILRQEDIPVAELCHKVGYGNVSYFIKLFREIVGVTPAKYKKMSWM